jgi:hypothetical protein
MFPHRFCIAPRFALTIALGLTARLTIAETRKTSIIPLFVFASFPFVPYCMPYLMAQK